MDENTLTKEQVLKAVDLIDGDGHTIFKRDILEEAGWPKPLIDKMCKVYKSDTGEPKGTIFNNEGQPLIMLEGVYGLDVLQFIARMFEIKYPPCFGRGFQARALTEDIRKHFIGKEKS